MNAKDECSKVQHNNIRTECNERRQNKSEEMLLKRHSSQSDKQN
jgi:hypothetical protein